MNSAVRIPRVFRLKNERRPLFLLNIFKNIYFIYCFGNEDSLHLSPG